MVKFVTLFSILIGIQLRLSGATDWEILNESIARVECYQASNSDDGAGIVISASDASIRVLTAAHILKNATSCKVWFHADRAVSYLAIPVGKSSDALDL